MLIGKQIIDFNKNICDDIKIELIAQGHNLTGETVNSIVPQVSLIDGTIILEAEGSKVIAILDKGVTADKASMKQFAFLVDYFKKRGLPEKEAKGAAAATIKTWMKEGMSTKASAKYSETGERQSAVEVVFKENNDRYDELMGSAVEEMLFPKEEPVSEEI